MAGNEDRVRARAHAIWEEEGRPDGQALDHWLRAEQDVAAADDPPPTESNDNAGGNIAEAGHTAPSEHDAERARADTQAAGAGRGDQIGYVDDVSAVPLNDDTDPEIDRARPDAESAGIAGTQSHRPNAGPSAGGKSAGTLPPRRRG